MKPINEIRACFIDHGGLYLPWASRLSQAYKQVLYYDPNEEAFERINESMIGDSFPENERLEKIDDLWIRKKDIDLFIFPDSNLKSVGIQAELQSQGYPVWGSFRAAYLEQSREAFIKVLQSLGLEVPPYKRIVGVTALRNYLKGEENQIIKISRYRRTMETCKWRSWDDDEGWLDQKAVDLGGVKDLVPFLVFESIDTPIEIGADTFCIDGQFPDWVLDGTETKDRSYFGAFKPRTELPPQSQAVLELIAPVLKKTGQRNFWSMEIRVKDDEFYFVDPTPRAPIPGSASQIEMYENLPEIIAAGAEGELVEPKVSEPFSMECAVCSRGKAKGWSNTKIPKELERWLKPASYCVVNGRHWFPPMDGDEGDEIGWLVAIGKTPEETLETLKSHVALLPDGLEAKIESLAETIAEIDIAKQEGIPITDEEMPDPADVIEVDA